MAQRQIEFHIFMCIFRLFIRLAVKIPAPSPHRLHKPEKPHATLFSSINGHQFTGAMSSLDQKPSVHLIQWTATKAQSLPSMEHLLYLLPSKPQSVAVRYSVSALLVVCSLTIFAAMEAQSGFIGLFTFLPAVFLAGLMFDRGSGFVATALALLGVLWLLRPQWSATLILPLFLFTLVAIAFATIAELLRKEMEKVVASERSKTLLLQEVAHRTKNNLAMLSAMVRLQSRTLGKDASDALETTSQRIQTMAEVYDHLMLRDQTKIVDLKEYVGDIARRLIALGGEKPVAVRCELEETYAHSEVAVPIAIIINELVTNSLKYGFPDERPGQILVELHSDHELVLAVSDNGVGMLTEQVKQGIGSKVVALLAQQLNGTLVYEDAKPGCRVVLRMPRPKL
jgi:two-component sensor histidine kinase